MNMAEVMSMFLPKEAAGSEVHASHCPGSHRPLDFLPACLPALHVTTPSPRLSFLNPCLIYSLATGQLTSFARFMLLILWMMLGDEFMGGNMIFRWAPTLSLSLSLLSAFDFLGWRIGRRPSSSSLLVDRLQQAPCSTQKSQVVTGYLCIPTYF